MTVLWHVFCHFCKTISKLSWGRRRSPAFLWKKLSLCQGRFLPLLRWRGLWEIEILSWNKRKLEKVTDQLMKTKLVTNFILVTLFVPVVARHTHCFQLANCLGSMLAGSPFSPFVPFAPFNPPWPLGPEFPGIPRLPFIPIVPFSPFSPLDPPSPLGPIFPGVPIAPCKPRFPVVPFSPLKPSFQENPGLRIFLGYRAFQKKDIAV